MTKQANILFTRSSLGGNIVGKLRFESSDSSQCEKRDKKQQRAAGRAQRAWAGSPCTGFSRSVPRGFIRCLNDVRKRRSAAGADAVWPDFTGALGATARKHVSRESHRTEWSGLSRFMVG